MGTTVDERFHAEVLQKHGEHIGNIIAALVKKLTTIEQTVLKQAATKAERARLLEELAAIIRITGGNFRLLHRLLTQIARLLDINVLEKVTLQVVEAAGESLVIGAV